MTVPTTTPGTLGRVRAWITKTPPSNERSMTRRVPRGSLLAALPAIAAVALTGALAAGAQAAALPDDRSTHKPTAAEDCDKRAIFVETRGRWRCQNLYMARVTLDARKQPDDNREGARINAIKAGEWITISCQVHGFEKGTGESLGLYDMLPGGEFIPDKYVRTLYTGRIPGAPRCDPLPGGRRWRPAPW